MTLIAKAKKLAVAYEKPPAPTGKRGRPKLKGDKVKLAVLFDSHKDQFTETDVTIYGKQQRVSSYILYIECLWGQKLYQKLRFVLVVHDGVESILVSTDTSLSAEQIITLYSYHFKIESTFRALTFPWPQD